MKAGIFRHAAKDIFGDMPGWQRDVAEALHVNRRTVRRWAKDGAPDWVAESLRKLARNRCPWCGRDDGRIIR